MPITSALMKTTHLQSQTPAAASLSASICYNTFSAIRQRGRRGFSTGRGKKKRRTGGNGPFTGRTGATVPASFLPSTGTKTLADSHLRFIPLLPQLLLFIALWKTNTSFLVSEIRDENHQQFLSTYRSVFDKRGHAYPFSMY